MPIKNTEQFIFLPGWGFSPQIFHSFAKQLTGASTFLALPFIDTLNLDLIAKQLAKSIPAQSTIIAWSLGGLIALKLCAVFPNKYQRLILISTTSKFVQDHNWQGIDTVTATRFISTFNKHSNHLLQRFINLVNYPNKNINFKNHIYLNSVLQAKDYDKESLLHYLKLLFNTDLRDAYASITIPTLHLLGSHDAIVFAQESELKALNNNTNIRILESAGHALFLTHQDECVHQVEYFLKGDHDGK